jgi:hypothetical protein
VDLEKACLLTFLPGAGLGVPSVGEPGSSLTLLRAADFVIAYKQVGIGTSLCHFCCTSFVGHE